MNRYPLTKEQFEKLQQSSDWDIKEIPFETAITFPNIPRQKDVIAVYASGDLNATKRLNGITAVFGMDVIAHETRPNAGKNEPDLNIYHCVIQMLAQANGDFEYLMHSYSEEETLFGHWKDYSVLDEYLKAAKPKEQICDRPIEDWCDGQIAKIVQSTDEAKATGPQRMKE